MVANVSRSTDCGVVEVVVEAKVDAAVLAKVVKKGVVEDGGSVVVVVVVVEVDRVVGRVLNVVAAVDASVLMVVWAAFTAYEPAVATVLTTIFALRRGLGWNVSASIKAKVLFATILSHTHTTQQLVQH